MPSMSLALRLDPAAHWLSQTQTHTHKAQKPVCLHAEVEIHLRGRNGHKDLECIGENVNEAGGKYDLDKM